MNLKIKIPDNENINNNELYFIYYVRYCIVSTLKIVLVFEKKSLRAHHICIFKQMETVLGVVLITIEKRAPKGYNYYSWLPEFKLNLFNVIRDEVEFIKLIFIQQNVNYSGSLKCRWFLLCTQNISMQRQRDEI